jgi:Flp pilus assembly CpaE family ATPase
LQVYWTLSNDFETVSRSINSGTPVAGNGARSRYARDLQALGADIVGAGAPSRISGVRRIGDLLGRLRRRTEPETP